MAMAYGEWLKQQRKAAGLTQQELADKAVMTRTHIAHIEAGRRWPSEEDARRLDEALNTGNVLSSFLPNREGRPVGSHFEDALQFEQQASVIREFALSYVPGILQTEAYARAVLGNAPFPQLSDEERDSAVVTRLERSRVLTDPVTPVVWALLDEAVLRRPIGAPPRHGGTDHAHCRVGREPPNPSARDPLQRRGPPAPPKHAHTHVFRGSAAGGLRRGAAHGEGARCP